MPESTSRNELRQRRNALPAWRRIQAETALANQVLQLVIETGANAIAGYWPFDGEANVIPLLAELARRGNRTYLPRIAEPDAQLRFIRWRPCSALRLNRFGIPEPVTGARCRPDHLDMVLVPLVGADWQGNRLGSGAGYYDRCFAFRQYNQRRPLLVGIALACQIVETLPANPWDIPMDIVLAG